MPPIPPPARDGTTTSTPVPLYWCAYGPVGAPRLLVLHGGPGAHHDYLLPQLLTLADDYELVFYDQRGGGRSKTDDPTPITWQTQVADLALVAQELGGPSLTLLGYSFGALLAMLYATNVAAGDSVGPAPTHLVLLDPAPVTRAYRAQFEAEFAARSKSAAVEAMRAELMASGLRERDPEAYRQRTFELAVAGYFYNPAAARDLTPFRVTGRVQQQIWESLGDFDLLPKLSQLRTSALVVHGREDPIPLASAEAVATALHARLVILEQCGHVPYVEAPAALFAAVRAFLT